MGLGRGQQALWTEGKVLRAELTAPFTGPPTHPASVRPTLEEGSHQETGILILALPLPAVQC